MPTFALTSAYIEMLHDEGIALFWPGIEPVAKYEIINLGLLESSVKQPLQSAFGADAYPQSKRRVLACSIPSLPIIAFRMGTNEREYWPSTNSCMPMVTS
jgi:hypothetical protein